MKKLSLLSLLLLTSTSCLASSDAAMMSNFGTAILMMIGTAFLVYFIINLILTTCFYRLILKDKTTPLKMLLKAATLSLFFWSLILFFLDFVSNETLRIMGDHWPIAILVFTTIVVVTAMPIYRLLFLRKKQ
jgi:ABC-type transport system involved in cytochrome c biogenesis permease subunit